MTIKSAAKKVITLIFSIAVCLVVGIKGSFHEGPGVQEWYEELVKPVFSLHSPDFSLIWIFSFIFMGLCLYLILQTGLKKNEVTPGFILFVLQFLLTIAWSYTFFGQHSLFLAFMCIIALGAVLLCAVIQIFRFSVGAGMALIPCFCWVCYLGYLNYGIMVLNNATFAI